MDCLLYTSKRKKSKLHANMALEEMAVEYVLETREKAPGMGGDVYKRQVHAR